MKIALGFALAVAVAGFGGSASAQSALFECGPVSSGLHAKLNRTSFKDLGEDDFEEEESGFDPSGITLFGFPAKALGRYWYDDGAGGEDTYTATVDAQAGAFIAAAEAALGAKCEAMAGAANAGRCRIKSTKTGDRDLMISTAPELKTSCAELF